MSIDITCHVALLDPAYAHFTPSFTFGSMSISDYFAEGSKTSNGHDIHLALSRTREDEVRGSAPGKVVARQLHKALGRLLQNPPAPVGTPIRDIGLLLAGTYQWNDDVFGIMFDRGFETNDDRDSPTAAYSVPREGCAVFLDTIAKYRSGEAFDAEVTYTATHELGHVFNLGHDNGTKTFMGRSIEEAVRPKGWFGFSDDQKQWLSSCSTSPAVWPGGDRYWDDDSVSRLLDTREPQSNGDVRLLVRPPSRPVWFFEPFELDIRVAAPAYGTIRIPNEIDPGYSRFTIWIEGRDGIRPYRPPRFYCGPRRFLSISGRGGFSRDISLFAQSGGYTFTRPGIYRVWAELRMGKGIVRSNRAELEIKPQDADARRFGVLRCNDHARVVYHRHVSPGSRALSDLAELVRTRPRDPASGNVAYAVGRTYASLVQRTKNRERRRALRRIAIAYLERAQGHAHLGAHARRKAGMTLETMRASKT